MFAYSGSSNDDGSVSRPAETASHHSRPTATAGLLQGAAANARRIIMAFPPVNDENQQNVRIQQAVNRYNGNLPGYCRSSAAYKCSLIRNKVNKPATQPSDITESSGSNPETRYPSAGPGNLPVVFLKQPSQRPIKSFKTLARPSSNDVAGLPSSRFLDDTSDKYSDMKSTRSVLEVLHDLSRKRIHGKDESEDNPKRRCRGLVGEVSADGQVPYRPLFIPKSKVQFSPKKDQTTQTLNVSGGSGDGDKIDEKLELRRTLAKKNNEIMASLSSSKRVLDCLKRKRVPEPEEKSPSVDSQNSAPEKKAKETPNVAEAKIETLTSTKEYKSTTSPRSPPTKDKFMQIYWQGSDNSETKRKMLETMKNNPCESQFKNTRPVSDPSPGATKFTAGFGFSPITPAPSISITSALSKPSLPSSPPSVPVSIDSNFNISPQPKSASSQVNILSTITSSPQSATPAIEPTIKKSPTEPPQPSLPTGTINFAVSEWSTAPKPKSVFVNTSPNTSRFSANLTPTVTMPLLFGSPSSLDGQPAAPSPPTFGLTTDIKNTGAVDLAKRIPPPSTSNPEPLSALSSLPAQPESVAKEASSDATDETKLPSFSFGTVNTTSESKPPVATVTSVLEPAKTFSFGSADEPVKPVSFATAAEPAQTFSFGSTKMDPPSGPTFSFGMAATKVPSVETVKPTLIEEKPVSFAFSKPAPSFSLPANSSSPSSMQSNTTSELTTDKKLPSESPSHNLFSFGAKSDGEGPKTSSTPFSFSANAPVANTGSSENTVTSNPILFTGKTDEESKPVSVFSRLGQKKSAENDENSVSAPTTGLKIFSESSSLNPTPVTTGSGASSFPSSTAAEALTSASKPELSAGTFSFGSSASSTKISAFGATTSAPPTTSSSTSSFALPATAVKPTGAAGAFSFGKSDVPANTGTFSFGGASTQKANPFGSLVESAKPNSQSGYSAASETSATARPPTSVPDASKPFQLASGSVFGSSGGISTGLFGSTKTQPQSVFPTSTSVSFTASSQNQKEMAPSSATSGFSSASTFAFGSSKPANTTTAPPAFGSSSATPSFAAVTTAGQLFGSSAFPLAPSAPSTLGSMASNATTAQASFVTAAPSTAFGQMSAPTQSTFGAFGAPPAPTTSFPSQTFGASNSPYFGSVSSTTTSTFGSTSASAPSTFGSVTPAFGAPNPPTFGAVSSTTSTSAFGSTQSFSSPMSFNAPASAPSAFGNSTANSSAGSTPFGFGAPSNSSGSVFSFGSTPPSAPASAAPAPFAFGSTQGKKLESTSMFSFGSNSTPSPSGGAFSFGSSASTSNPGTSGIASPFGAPSPGAFSVPGTFSIGTGSSQRRVGRVRRKQ